MPYKDPERAKAQRAKYYREHKDDWKNADGTWKLTGTPEQRKQWKLNYLNRNRQVLLDRAKAKRLQQRRTGTCPICREPNKRLLWDHDHTTGQFRDYICSGCNLTIGHAYEKVGTLRRVIAYLLKHRRKHGTAR